MAGGHGQGGHGQGEHGQGQPAEAGAGGSEGSVVLAFCAAAVVALFGATAGRSAPAAAAPGPRVAQRPLDAEAQVVRGRRGVVSSASPEASAAGVAMLRAGGNAVDALVAASFAVSVARPESTGLGGGGFALTWDRATSAWSALDGREVAPAAARASTYATSPRASLDGPRAAGVPGLVAMLARLHREQGRLPWRQVLEPAIRLAEEGVPVTEALARAIERRTDVLARHPASAALFLPGGVPLQAGDRLVQADLGRTLRTLAADGPDAFYRGALAATIAREVEAAGGFLRATDLEGYEVRRREPVVGRYRGATVASFPPPSAGGALLVQMLRVLEGWDLQRLGWHGPEHVHRLAETMRRAYADRSAHVGDPDFVDVPLAWLTSGERAAQIRGEIDLARATPSERVHPGSPTGVERPNTTHISVIDAAGNAASSTQTINTGLGSGYVVPGTGLLLNNEMDDFATEPGRPNAFGLVQGAQNAVAPGRRPLSSMSPTIVLDARGEVALVVGSPGGSKITTAVLQVVSNLLDFGMSPAEAVAAPRVHHQWQPDQLVVEPGLPEATVRGLAARGHRVQVADAGLGDVQAIFVRGPNRTGVSDPRGEGRPAAE